MANQSLADQAKKIEAEVRQVLRAFDLLKLGVKLRNILADLTQVLGDARIYAQAFELSETEQERHKNGKLARKFLERAKKNILAASEHDIFSAIDVAQLSARIEQLKEQLQ